MDGITIRHELKAGDLGRILYLHGTIYSAEYSWDHTFEAHVADPLAAFALRQNPKERIWLVEAEGRVDGCIAIVESDPTTARVRWFVLDPLLRGRGIGRNLLGQAVEFSRMSGYLSIFLWTVRDLLAAGALYREAGFQVTEETTHTMWSQVVCEQRYDLLL